MRIYPEPDGMTLKQANKLKPGVKVTATVRVLFCAAHRLQSERAGLCRSLHGHNYELCVTATTADERKDGMVIDFRELIGRVQSWVDGNWDHAFIYEIGDPISEAIVAAAMSSEFDYKCRVYPVSFAPTAENMAEYLVHDIFPDIFKHTRGSILSVQVIESPDAWARAELTGATP